MTVSGFSKTDWLGLDVFGCSVFWIALGSCRFDDFWLMLSVRLKLQQCGYSMATVVRWLFLFSILLSCVLVDWRQISPATIFQSVKRLTFYLHMFLQIVT
ncbi:unnamed protein product [Brassica rapa]|uniref:Uncharacterized protein n=2 Tax=Brassica TaxID=3705 RepID=A0A8D9I0H7_BRACM|nr:unnamed protein product [Brassica napus]CAG7906994.1 unnamed protein product [Brassica rapa]